jgi:DNA recombination protein RmuC
MTSSLLYVAAGTVIGFVIGWILAASRFKSANAVAEERSRQLQQREAEALRLRDELDAANQGRTEAMTRLEESQKNLQEQKDLIETMEGKLSETFKALSLEALSKNSTEFIKLAEGKLKEQTVEGRKDLEGKKELIDQSIVAISKTLTDVQKKIDEVGEKSGERLTEVSTLLRKHEDVTFKLKDTTEHLRQALASSKKRGEWGERMAEDVIRLAGLAEGINYIKQKTLDGSAGRPDFTFLMPNSLKINMDVKFPLDNYQHYLEAQTEHDKRRFKDELIKNTKVMMKQVTSRDYINPADNTVDYVIMFVPNEQVYGFINDADPTIMDEALKQKVILCSPFTLYAVLSVVRQAIENFNLERTASEILQLLADFSKQWAAYKDKTRAVGEKIDSARKEFDLLVTTRTNMLERPLRKIDDLRKQSSVGIDSDITFDDPSLL